MNETTSFTPADIEAEADRRKKRPQPSKRMKICLHCSNPFTPGTGNGPLCDACC